MYKAKYTYWQLDKFHTNNMLATFHKEKMCHTQKAMKQTEKREHEANVLKKNIFAEYENTWDFTNPLRITFRFFVAHIEATDILSHITETVHTKG